MLVKEFKRCIHSDVKPFLDDKQFETLEEAGRLAEYYFLTHRVSFINNQKPNFPHTNSKVNLSRSFSPQNHSEAP